MKLNIKPLITNNKDFETIIISIMFPYTRDGDDIAKEALLPSIISYMNEYYQTEEEFYKILKKTLIRYSRVNTFKVGNSCFLSFDFIIPSVNALGYDNLDNQFDLFSKIIYNPKVIDDGLDAFELERNKKAIKISINNMMNVLRGYQSYRLTTIIDPKEKFFKPLGSHVEDIDKLNPAMMYDFYKSIVKQNPLVFVYGNIDDEKCFTNYIDKYIYRFSNKQIEFSDEYDYYFECKDTVNKITEESKFENSSITLLYAIKDYKNEDFVLLRTVCSLLSSLSSRLLAKKLRDELQAIYSSSVVPYSRNGLLEITSYIIKDNKDKVVKGTKEVLTSLKDESVVSMYLDNIKERAHDALIRRLDNKFALMDDELSLNLKFDKSNEELYEDLLKIDAKDIVKFMDRLVLHTEFFIKEAENEENRNN